MDFDGRRYVVAESTLYAIFSETTTTGHIEKRTTNLHILCEPPQFTTSNEQCDSREKEFGFRIEQQQKMFSLDGLEKDKID